LETIQGLHELIKNRLIEKNGNFKLTQNVDIIAYGKVLGLNENQLLFKVIEIEETIDWTKEKGNVLNTELFINKNDSSTQTNIIYCNKCNTANQKSVANFCVNCGVELNPQPVKAESQFVAQDSVPKKSKTTYIIIGIAVLVILILIGVVYSVSNEDNGNYNSIVVSTSGLTQDTILNSSYNNTKDSNSPEDNSTLAETNSSGEKIDNYIKYNENCIKDLNTNYYWYIAPDKNFNLESAMSFSKRLNEKNLNWRIPTYSEIKTLYNSEFSAGQGYYTRNEYFPAKIHNVFDAVGSGSWFWVSDKSNINSKAYAINLHEGIKVSVNIQNNRFPVHLILISK
jgi:hypothetical protein